MRFKIARRHKLRNTVSFSVRPCSFTKRKLAAVVATFLRRGAGKFTYIFSDIPKVKGGSVLKTPCKKAYSFRTPNFPQSRQAADRWREAIVRLASGDIRCDRHTALFRMLF